MERACEIAAGWAHDPEVDGAMVGIAVNVSAVQLFRDDFVATVRGVLERTGLEPSRLKLELTESSLLADIEETIRKMRELRAMGVELLIDDFGTGYSCLSYLGRLPFTSLKIDRSFVHELNRGNHAGRRVSTLVTLAKEFGMNVIAWSQNLTPEKAAAAGAQWVDKDTLFREADFLSLHVVLSERTRHIVGAHELALMKPTAYIVNTARGPLIDRDALIAAVVAKRIAGVALDTFDVEPLPDDDALRTLDNVWLTPHLGYTVRELLVPFYEDTVENLLAYMGGNPVRLLGGGESH